MCKATIANFCHEKSLGTDRPELDVLRLIAFLCCRSILISRRSFLDWKLESEEPARRARDDGKTHSWVGVGFPQPRHRGRHYHAAPIQQDYIRPAGCCLVECPI